MEQRIIGVFAAGIAAATPAMANTVTWSGGGSNADWSTAANWGGVVPGTGDLLVFGGSSQLTNIDDLSESLLSGVGGVTFSSGGFSVSGSDLTLGGGWQSADDQKISLKSE